MRRQLFVNSGYMGESTKENADREVVFDCNFTRRRSWIEGEIYHDS